MSENLVLWIRILDLRTGFSLKPDHSPKRAEVKKKPVIPGANFIVHLEPTKRTIGFSSMAQCF